MPSTWALQVSPGASPVLRPDRADDEADLAANGSFATEPSAGVHVQDDGLHWTHTDVPDFSWVFQPEPWHKIR
jgi:hypothetical protein